MLLASGFWLLNIEAVYAGCHKWYFDANVGYVARIVSHTILTTADPARQYQWDQPTPDPDYSVDHMYSYSTFSTGGGSGFVGTAHGNAWNPSIHDNAGNGIRFQLQDTFNNVDKLVLINDFDFSAGASDGLSIFLVNLYDNTGATLASQFFFAANSSSVQVFNFSQTNHNVSSFDFQVYNTYTRQPLQISEIALGSNTNLTCPTPAALEVTKTASAPGFTTGDIQEAPVGTVITYTYVITNTGQSALNAITINDVHEGENAPPVPDIETASLTDNGVAGDSSNSVNNGTWDMLGPGDMLTVTASYTISQEDINLHQ